MPETKWTQNSTANLLRAIKTLDPSKTDQQARAEAELLLQYFLEHQEEKRRQKTVLLIAMVSLTIFFSVVIFVNTLH